MTIPAENLDSKAVKGLKSHILGNVLMCFVAKMSISDVVSRTSKAWMIWPMLKVYSGVSAAAFLLAYKTFLFFFLPPPSDKSARLSFMYKMSKQCYFPTEKIQIAWLPPSIVRCASSMYFKYQNYKLSENKHAK